MFRKDNLILTYGVGEALFNDPTFWVFVHSCQKFSPDADLVIITNDMSEEVRDRLSDLEVEVSDFPSHKMSSLYRDRHLAFYEYLNDHGHKYKHVLISDCRDVVLQRNPFEWRDEWRERYGSINGDKNFLDHFVAMTAEGHLMQKSGFACIEHFEFERNVPECFKKTDRQRYVINGGIFLGTPRAMQDWNFLIWTASLKSSERCTDQAAVNWLMYYLEDDDAYQVSFPQHDNLCLTGEGVKEGAVSPKLESGVAFNHAGRPYYIVHQWDRIDGLKEEILAQYPS